MKWAKETEDTIFEDIFLGYFQKIKLFSLKILKSESEAEDITQEIFLKLWTQKSEIKDIRSIEAFLYRMTRNAIYNHIKHLYIERDFINEVINYTSHSHDGYHTIYENELKERIHDAIANMPPQRKNIFMMSRHEGLSNIEIAERLNLSKRTIDNHIFLALTDLKKVFLILFATFFTLH